VTRASISVRRRLGIALCILCLGRLTLAQEGVDRDTAPRDDSRAQLPSFLVDSYVAIDVGSIFYDFTGRQLEPGFRAEAVETPHAAVRVVLFGHRFNRFLSAQLTYMRPVLYVSYRDINGDAARHHLFAHFGGLSLKPELPVTRRVSLHGEIGIGVTSRRALVIDDVSVIREAHYPSVLSGGGVVYHVNDAWNLTAGATYSPGSERHRQPRTLFWSGGVQYTMHVLPAARVRASRDTDAEFPKHVIQVEYTTGTGYGVNDFVSTKVPIFWRGSVEVAEGLAVHYERNVFHTRRVFALDIGASVSYWSSRRQDDRFATASVYPLLRFTMLRTRPADIYLCYSLAGPTYISRDVIDRLDTGSRFTFQDFMGAGAFIGRGRRLTAGIKINHYSNGNIFTRNAGVKVPLTVNLGYAFGR
jgi:hypothetical protein